MKILVDLDPNTYERIQALVADGKYDSVDQFLRAGADNQLAIEQADDEGDWESGREARDDSPSPANGSELSDESTGAGFQWKYDPGINAPTRSPISANRDEVLLFSQYYRFVPLKFAMVELANITSELESPVALDDFREHIQDTVIPLRDALVDWEIDANVKKQDRVSTGFPKRDSNNPERSMKRYLDHYVGRFRREAGKAAGLGHQLGLVSIRSDEESATIALTPAGRRFLRLQNPLLAEGPARDRSPLSDQEQGYLVAHIRRRLPWEYDFMEFVYDTIDHHEGTYTEHLAKFRVFLDQAPGFTEDPSDNRVRSHTAGTISRMVDLGLLERGSIRGEYVPVRPPEAFRVPSALREEERAKDHSKTTPTNDN